MIEITAGQVDYRDIPGLIAKALPEQGCVEVQRDAPGKEHSWHEHAVDETIVVLDGSLRFYWTEGEQICGPGDVIKLPAGTLHGSVALESGASYLIAMRDVAF